jgi:hypothetical protein
MKKLIPAIIAALLLLCVCFFLQNKRVGETVLLLRSNAESNQAYGQLH